MDGAKSMELETQAGQANFGLGSEKGSNGESNISIPLKEGETFTVRMSGGANENAELSGKGTGSGEEARISLSGNKLSLRNLEVTSININGKDNKDGKDINTLDISLERYQYKYTEGSIIEPRVIITDNGKTLTQYTDFQVAYNNADKKGTATAVITGIGDYKGTRKINFIIGDEDRDDLRLVHFDLNGHGSREIEDQLVESGKKAVKPNNPMETGWQFEGWCEDVSGNKAFDFNTAVTKDITLHGKWKSLDGDEPVLAVRFSDDPADGQTVSYDGAYYCIYTGSKIKPAVVVTYGNRILKEGTDYKLTYKNNLKVTKKEKPTTVKVTLKGNLSGSKTLEFSIRPKRIDDGTGKPAADIEIDRIVAENGKKIQSPEISYGDYVLSKADYGMDPVRPIAGTDKTVTIAGCGNFTGEIKDVPVTGLTKEELKAYKIKASVSVKKAKIYNGKAQSLTGEELKVYDGKNNELSNEKDVTVKYKQNINAGTAKVVITGKSPYYGKVTKTFKIKPDTTFELGNIKTVSGEIYCFPKKAEPELIVTKSDGTVLEAGKDYTVKYSANSKPGEHAKYTVNFTGNYKGRRTAKGEFKIKAVPMGNTSISVCDVVYLKPSKIKPVLNVTYEGALMKESTDYTVKYYYGGNDVTNKKLTLADSELPAAITVKVTGKKKFSGEKEGSFMVRKLPEGAFDLTNAKIYAKGTEKSVKKQEYTGKEVKPEIDVKVKKGSSYETVSGGSYIVSYVNNIERGKATIVVAGNNSETFGSKTASFTIGVRSIKDILQLVFEKFR